MYHQYFGLQKEPFGMTPDPAFLFLTATHREALAGVTYAILSRKGFVVLTGDAGTGKTTLLTRIIQSIPTTRARFSIVLNPMLTPAEFLELALLDFGVASIPESKAQRLLILKQFLIQAFEKHQVPVLVVDEAHKLSPEVLEEIRLLSNFELPEGKLLQIVLAGQSELSDVLNREDLRQLKQRIAVRLAIHPLSTTELEQYIQYRWTKAGTTRPHPFSPEALGKIAQCSRGIPRLVNVFCDNALMLAYGEGVSAVGASQIMEVARDLDVGEARNGRVKSPSTLPAGAESRAGLNGPANGTPRVPVAAPPPPPTIERYSTNSAQTSRLSRLAGKLGLAKRPIQQL